MNWLQKIAEEIEAPINIFELRRDGKLLFRGTEAECWHKLHQTTSSSVQWAMKYSGYTINPITEDWKDYYTWYGGD